MDKVKKVFKGIFYILLYFILEVTINLILYKCISNVDNTLLVTCATIFSNLLILFIFIILFRKKLIPDYNNFKKDYKTFISNSIKYWIVGLFIMVITNAIISLITSGMAANEETNRIILTNYPISSIISMVLVAPIIEELITRKIFKEAINNQYVYIIFSGLLFGFLHILVAESFLELLYIIPYAALGCSFAKMYYDTDNLWTSISFHSFHNLIAIILIFTGV